MANKRVIELNERTQIDMSDWLLVDSSTSTRKLSIATLLSYFTYYSLIFVEELPTQDIQPNVVYLVPHSGSDTQWDEYIYINNDWSLIGTATIDLSAIYQTKAAATVQDNNIPWYGTSSTAAGTTAKVATTAAGNLGALAAGQKVSIKFTNKNTASAPTLNVDSKGAHAIKAYGTTNPTVWWKAGDVVTFTYDGTNWIMGATQGEIEQINSDLADIAEATSGTAEVDITMPYVAPSDGYLTVEATDANSYAKCSLYGKGGTNLLGTCACSYDALSINSIFVRKGMKIYLNSSAGSYSLKFGRLN